MARAFLMCRWRFSPYEGDWWECCLERLSDDTWHGRPIIDGLSPHREPKIFAQTELAKDIANILHLGDQKYIWKIQSYTVTQLRLDVWILDIYQFRFDVRPNLGQNHIRFSSDFLLLGRG